MHTTKIPIVKDALPMLEFCIQPGDCPQVSLEVEKQDSHQKELERLAWVYRNEDLISVAGRKHPMVWLGTVSPDQFKLQSVGEYKPKNTFVKFVRARYLEAVEKAKSNLRMQDNPVISVRGWQVTDDAIIIRGGRATYFQFLATNRSIDEPLNKHDPFFPEGMSLRDYEVDDGRDIPPQHSTLVNMLGSGYNIRVKGRDGVDYLLLGTRKVSTGLYGGELSILGGTPHWQTKFSRSDVEENGLGKYLLELLVHELKEEVLLRPKEYQVRKASFFKNFTRAPEPIFEVEVDPGLKIEDIAARCFGNASALEEHSRLYAVPVQKKVIEALCNGVRGFSMNIPTRVASYLTAEGVLSKS